MTPYSSPSERVRALYRIPGSSEHQRVLEVCLGREPLLLSGSKRLDGTLCWYRKAVSEEASKEPPLPVESFDLVILHRTLEDLAARRDPRASGEEQRLLAEVTELLAPGGLVAGSISNVRNGPSIVWRLTRWLRASPIQGQGTDLSVRELGELLVMSGLVDVRIFRLMPDCDSPLRLVEIYQNPTRMMLRHEVSVGRVRLIPFLLKRLAIELGIYGWFQKPSIFFWARRPC